MNFSSILSKYKSENRVLWYYTDHNVTLTPKYDFYLCKNSSFRAVPTRVNKYQEFSYHDTPPPDQGTTPMDNVVRRDGITVSDLT
jgi:hypothetical protein